MPGRHRTDHNARTLVVAAAAAVGICAVAAAGWSGSRLLAADSCTGEVRLAVAAAPEIAAPVQATAARWAETAEVDDTCVAVEVTAREPADVAAAVADAHGGSLIGLGKANGTVQVPQVWLPDSSLWPHRLQAAAPGFQPATMSSVATSPVVLAMPQPVATSLVPKGTTLTWPAVARQLGQNSQLSAGLVDPARDAAALSGLLAFGQATAGLGAQAEAATVATLRTLAQGSSAVREDLLTRFPQALDADTVAGSLTAAVLPEQAVAAYNAAGPSIPLTAVRVSPEPPALDYPFLVMPGVSDPVSQAAGGLRAALSSAAFHDALAQHGLRDPAGSGTAPGGAGSPANDAAGPPSNAGNRPGSSGGAPSNATDSPGSSGSAPRDAGNPPGSSGSARGGAVEAAVPDIDAIDRALSAWLALTQPGRILAVIDVSGSMISAVPSAGNRSRQEVTVEAATRGLELFDDSWALGLWTFSTELEGDRDYRELLPVSPLSAARERAVRALADIRPKKNGQTGLYDTALAAYRTMQDDWRPGRLNTVVLMTDGDNVDKNGLSLRALLAELDKRKDPARPVDIVIIGIGPDINQGPLRQIATATGGGVFVAPDPADIGTIFLKALALHT